MNITFKDHVFGADQFEQSRRFRNSLIAGGVGIAVMFLIFLSHVFTNSIGMAGSLVMLLWSALFGAAFCGVIYGWRAISYVTGMLSGNSFWIFTLLLWAILLIFKLVGSLAIGWIFFLIMLVRRRRGLPYEQQA